LHNVAYNPKRKAIVENHPGCRLGNGLKKGTGCCGSQAVDVEVIGTGNPFKRTMAPDRAINRADLQDTGDRDHPSPVFNWGQGGVSGPAAGVASLR